MSRALQINSSLQGWMARNTKPVPLEEKGWVITMKKISIILLSAVLVFSMAACNGGKEKADNQTEKQTESVKPTEEAEMATKAVTEVTTEAGSEETEKDVTFMLDEFANVALPDDFCSLLSTMRSREISSIIIIQNFAQLKALFKDTWETIPGNCDTFIYLGGNEQSTHKYVSELLGKGTIDKKSSGETKGRQGSSSRNYDVLGRELFTPDEVRKLDNKKCIIFIRGFDPIMDNKFIPFNHPMFNQTADGKGEPYVHQIRGADNLIGPPFEILSDKAVKYYEKLKDKGENVYIDSLTYEQFMMLGDAELSRRFSMQDEAEQKAKIDREQANELEYVDESQKSDAAESANASNGSAGAKPVRNPEREKPKWEDTITNRMLHWSYTPEQKEEVKKALAAGVPKATILTYFYPEVTVEKMSSYRKKH